jgi:PAS domain S-box-containing protein
MADNKKNTGTPRAIPEKNFRGMVESTAGIPWVVDFSTFQFTYVGPQAEKILGYPAEQWYETDFWSDHIHPDDKQAALDYCMEASQKGADYDFEYRMIHRDGHSVWILDYVNIVNKDGKPIQLQGFMFDVSKDKATEQKLWESNSHLNALYRASPDMIFIHANDGRILEVNENTTRRYGYSLAEIQRLTVADLSAEENAADKAMARVQAAMRGEEPDFEWLSRDSSGKAFPVEVRLRKLDGGDAPGAPAVIAIVRDITNRKQTESALQQSKEDLDRAQQIAHIGSWSWDLESGQVEWSDEMYRIHGIAHEAFTADAWQVIEQLTHPDDRERVHNTAAKAVLEGRDIAIKYRIVRPGDEIRHVFGHGSLVSDEHGKPIKRVGVVQDITEQKQAEKSLRNIAAGVSAQTGTIFYSQLVKHLARLFDAEYAFIGLIDKVDTQTINTLAVWANNQLADNFSYSLEGTPCINVIGQRTLSLSTGIQQKFPKSLMLAEMGADSFIGSPLFDSQKNPTGLIVVLGKKPMPEYPQIIDTLEIFAARAGAEIERTNTEIELASHREHLEELVEQRTTELTNINQELESFSYSVSHDLRAPLRHIDGFSLALQEDYTKQLDEEGRQQLDRIRKNAQHMGQLIDDLLILSKTSRGDLKYESLDLSSMAQDIINKLQHYDAEREVRIDIQSKILAEADHRLMHVLLENLIGNAWKYTSKTDQASIAFSATTSEKGETIFCLRDNGAGFNMKYAEKLFTAFKRLHSDKEFEGTGIGLATVQRIINRHAGHIWAEAEIEKGASFYFTLGKQTPGNHHP